MKRKILDNWSMAQTPEGLRQAIRRYMQVRGLKAKPWAKLAHVGERTLPMFLAGHTKSLTTTTLEKLAGAQGDPVGVLTGEVSDPKDLRFRTVKRESVALPSEVRSIPTEEEMRNMQMMLAALQQIAKKLDEQSELLRALLAETQSPADTDTRQTA